MHRSRCFILVAAICVSTLALAADLTGTWAGKTADGYDVVLNLKSEGKQLSGTLLDADGKTEYPLKDVQSDGDKLAFIVDIQWQGSPLRILAKATTSAEQIQLHLETEDASWGSDATLTREIRKASAKP